MKKRAILYIRVSTDEQAKGYSPAYQEEVLKRYCQLHGIEVVAVFHEDYSAKTFNRPEFTKLLAMIKRKHLAELLLFTKWDRFSRNAPDAYAMISVLNKLAVEPQAIEQPLDLTVPENKIMLAFYLAAPEVENDRRALNTYGGMRRAKKEGRCISTAPRGYKNIRLENKKATVVPNKDAPIILYIFETLDSGVYNIEEVRRLCAKKGFTCSRNQFWNLVHNPFYCGEIIVPAYKDEPQEIVKGLHQPLISKELFYRVQDILNNRKRKRPLKNTKNEELPLRGFLICPRCNRNLTGSASKGNGGRYYYYHCLYGCKERVKANIINEGLKEIFRDISANKEVIDYYEKVMLEKFSTHAQNNQVSKKQVQAEIDKFQKKLQHARNLLLEGALDSKDYKEIKEEVEPEIRKLERELVTPQDLDADYKEYIRYGFSLFKNLDQYYEKADLEAKQKLIGSIFPEKLTFQENQYRTKSINPAVSLILFKNKQLGNKKTGLTLHIESQSRMVARRGIEPLFQE